MLISISNIYSYVQENLTVSDRKTRPLEQGEQLYLAGQVGNCSFVGQTVSARCITSQVAAEPHKIEIVFGDFTDYRQWKCICSCKAGAGEKCKHIVATLLYIYNATELGPLSCTDVEQAWGKRKQREIVEVIPTNEFCHVKRSLICEISMDNASIEQLHLKCLESVPDSEAAVHFRRRMNVSKLTVRNETFESILKHAQLNNQLCEMLYRYDLNNPVRNCCVTTYNKLFPCDALEICQNTCTNKEKWLEARQFRITGTRCYSLFTYSKDDWHIKATDYFYAKPFQGNFATKYGTAQEKVARNVYQAHLQDNEVIIECGLVVCQNNPWLACSPDGIVVQNSNKPLRLIEIKCPVIGAKKTIAECLPMLQYMELTKDGYKLKKKHTYFAQVQFYLCILNLSMCDLIIFSSFDNSVHKEEIKIDEEFCLNLLTKLKIIFFEKMLHVLCEPVKQ